MDPAVNYFKTPEAIAAQWKLAGIIKVEVAPNTVTNYGARSSNRLLNMVVGQRVSTFNIFGIAVSEGTPLYFIIKKEAGESPFGQSSSSRSDDGASVGGGGQKRSHSGSKKVPSVAEVSNYVWKFVPYANKQKHAPGLEDLTYYDLDDRGDTVVKKVGKKVYVGLATSTPSTSRMPGAKIGLANTEERITLFQRGMLPQVEIYMGV